MELTIVRTSERVDFTRCRQKWDWGYNHRIQPIRVAPALRFGDLIHQALALWYVPGLAKNGNPKRGRKPWLTFERLYDEQVVAESQEFDVRLDEDEEWVDARTLGVEMLKNYYEEYGRDEQFEIIAPEQAFQIDLYDEETDLYVCTYAGQLDAIIRDLNSGRVGLFEHKTAASIRTDHLQMDEQAGSYWAVAGPWIEETYGEPLEFILYNFLRKGLLDTRPQNNDGLYLNKPEKKDIIHELSLIDVAATPKLTLPALYELARENGLEPERLGAVSKSQPPSLFHRERVYRGETAMHSLLRRVIVQATEMNKCKTGESPIFKSVIGGCTGMFHCQFRDMCELHEDGQDWEALRDATMRVWDPYAAHELQEEKEK